VKKYLAEGARYVRLGEILETLTNAAQRNLGPIMKKRRDLMAKDINYKPPSDMIQCIVDNSEANNRQDVTCIMFTIIRAANSQLVEKNEALID
jgi:hypothetical protein